jgi:hydroxymethylglutaryl-CoA synthase
MTDHGILAAGAYAPRERVEASAFDADWGRFEAGGIETKAVAAPDEDAVTMAYEAGRRALDAADLPGSDLAGVALATTTPPTAEEDPTVHLAELFDLPDAADVRLYTGSTRAGTQALVDALGAPAPRLVVASDRPRGEPETAIEHAAGAGAAAFLVGPSPAAAVRAHAGRTELYQGTRFRRAGEDRTESLDITAYEREAFVGTVAAAVEATGVDPADLDAAVLQAPDGRLPYRAAGRLDVDPSAMQEHLPVHDLGDLGAASVPVGLVRALAAGDGPVLAASFGSGAGADALVVEPVEPVPTATALDGGASLSYAAYLKRRGELFTGPPGGGGAYVSVPAWKRTVPQRYRLVAGECPACGALDFPPSGACGSCHEPVDHEPVRLDRRGEVEAVTVISRGGAPPEFAEQQARSGDFAVAIVALDGPGGRTASVPAQVVDTDPDAVAVGDRVAATVRRIYTQEGVTRYGFKMRPA